METIKELAITVTPRPIRIYKKDRQSIVDTYMRNIVQFGTEQQIIDILPVFKDEVIHHTESKVFHAEKQRIDRIKLQIAKQFTKQSDVYKVAAKLDLSDEEYKNRLDIDNYTEILKGIAEKVFKGPIPFSSRQTSKESHEDVYIKTIVQSGSVKEIKKALQIYKDLVHSSNKTLNSKHNRFQTVRKQVADRFGDTSAIYKFSRQCALTKEEFLERQEEMDQARAKRLSERKQTNQTIVLRTIDEFMHSNDVYDQLIALQLASGARFIELVKSTFKPSSSEGEISIKDLAKKQKGVSKRPVIGMDVKEFLELLESVRKHLADQYDLSADNKTITTTITPPINARIKKLGLGNNIKATHDLRKIYSEIAWLQLPDAIRHSKDKDVYVQELFLHKTINTSKSYANVRVRKTKKNADIGNLKDIENKFEEVDAVNDHQDRSIEELQQEKQTDAKPDTVSLINMEGQVVEFPKHKRGWRNPNLSEKLRKDVIALHERKVKITRIVLRHIGYGALVINENKDFIKGYKQ